MKIPALKPFIALIRRNVFETLMLSGAAVSLGFFIAGSIGAEKNSGVGGSVATLVSGAAERKGMGAKGFSPVLVGQKFYDLDAVWTGKNQSAEIALDTGIHITLGEKTLIVLKRPFRRRYKPALDEQIRMVHGEVRLGGGGKSLKSSRSSGLRKNELTDGSEGAPKEVDLQKGSGIFPPHQAELYYRDRGKVEIRLAWTKIKTGYLKVSGRKGGEVYYAPIKEQMFAALRLDNDETYQWAIMDDKKVNLLGPFSFELHMLDSITAKRLLTEKPEKPLLIYW
ncbi:MAG: hypothetical protein A2X94_00395 [Bdellovibrionales bacterium GWB1_55_8]|nr:MAG: hypothetical protein A2X94_00395 [Bdellovibrionales bacterium GWB1_55_8]